MSRQQALLLFIAKASALVAFLEREIASGHDRILFFGNGEIALQNVRSWLAAAQDGTLSSIFGKGGFGISKSDLTFGKAEDAMHELESLYREHLS